MARNQGNRGGNRGGRGRNNNPEGRNQYSGVMDIARERPVAAAAVAAGAAAAGLFLWSKRAQISDQISSLSDQIGEWTDSMSSASSGSSDQFDDTGGFPSASGSTGTSSRRGRGMSETGGGNASLGSTTGGGGSTGSTSGRGRARQSPTG